MPQAPAHPSLRGWVEPYRGYRISQVPAGVHHGLPSTGMTVVLALDEQLEVGWLGERPTRHWAMVSGLHTTPAAIHHSGFQHGVQLAFTPAGSRALLGQPAAALAATIVPLDELLGPSATRLYDEVATARTWAERFDVLDRHLRGLAVQRRDVEPVRAELAWAWQQLVRSRGRTRVAELAHELGWSRRHLSGRFGAEFGLSPKQLTRVVRFMHARRLLPGGGLAAVAAQAGYADQSHLTREWRELAGCTPSAWLREEFPFVQDAGQVPAAG
ncbi:MAG: AraC family transcriptional regulator [Nocardioidaceae bacterium]